MAAAAPGPADPGDPDRPGGPEPAGAARQLSAPGPPDAASARPPAVVELDVRGLPAGLRTVAALSRLRLAARRTGHAVRLYGAAPALRELLERAGLGGEFEWEAEEREDPLGVEE
ncbi:hypothetical protein AB0M29_10215 [Streptomyces sp. NPDC051976]|uniref:hypothetical protein n=1 Tax=Streptomyces sp. NPDC051976 TaxID=3154947 RepID=UPI00341B98F5